MLDLNYVRENLDAVGARWNSQGHIISGRIGSLIEVRKQQGYFVRTLSVY